MAYDIKFQPNNKLFSFRYDDGSRYGRKIQAKTKEALIKKLNEMFIVPDKQNSNDYTLKDAFILFLAHIEKRHTLDFYDGHIRKMSKSAYDNYHFHIRTYMGSCCKKHNESKERKIYSFININKQPIANVKIKDIDLKFMKDAFNSLLIHKKGLALKSYSHFQTTLKTVLMHFSKEHPEILSLHQVQNYRIAKPKKEAFCPTPLDAQQVLKTADEICDEKHSLYLHIMAYGLRPSEANALQPKDFDFDKRTLRINKAYTGDGELSACKNLSSKRTVTIGLDLAIRIQNYLNKHPHYDWLFQTDIRGRYKGFPIQQKSLKERSIKLCLKHLGSDIEWEGATYALRHYYGSQMGGVAKQLGKNDRWLSKNMGHSQVSTTKNIYTHDVETETHEESELIQKTLFG